MLRGLLRHGDTYLARVLAAVSRSAKWLAHLKNMGATLLHEVLWRKACRWSRSGSTSLSTRLLKVAVGGRQTKLADPVVPASLYNVLEESSRETERRVVTDRRTREVAAVRTYSAPLVSVYLGFRAPQFVSLRSFYRFADISNQIFFRALSSVWAPLCAVRTWGQRDDVHSLLSTRLSPWP